MAKMPNGLIVEYSFRVFFSVFHINLSYMYFKFCNKNEEKQRKNVLSFGGIESSTELTKPVSINATLETTLHGPAVMNFTIKVEVFMTIINHVFSKYPPAFEK